MTSKVKWEDVAPACSVAEFAAKNNLDIQSLRLGRGVMILPNDTMLTEMPKQHLFSPSSKEVLFVLRESGVDASLYQDERDRRELVLKHTTVVLPMLYYIGGATSSVVLGVVSNWIYSKFVKNRQSEIQTTIRYESADLRPDGSIQWRRVEGPADQVSELLLQESKCPAGEATTGPAVAGNNIQPGSQWIIDQKPKLKKASRKHKR